MPPSLQNPVNTRSDFSYNQGDTNNISTHVFPEQQQPKLKRSSSFRDKFSNLTPSISRSNSPLVRSQTGDRAGSTTYPEAPQLALQSSALSQLLPIQSRAVTPHSKSMSPPAVSAFANGDGQSAFPSYKKSPSPLKETTLSSGPLQNHSMNSSLVKRGLNINVGLVNLGNSCYMNCIIQCLLGTRELVQIFLDDSYKNHVNLNSRLGSKGVLAKYFSQLIHKMCIRDRPWMEARRLQ